MSATDILFDPIIKPKQTLPAPDNGVVREGESISIEMRPNGYRSVYMLHAGEIMDTVVTKQTSTELIDVRREAKSPNGILHLTGLISRFYDGSEEIWIACPGHMPPDRFRFRGRFGLTKVLQLPVDHGSPIYIYWSWIDTNAGSVPAIDLGLVMVPRQVRWYRVFSNKNEAISYYKS